jgi:hypothetical protein
LGDELFGTRLGELRDAAGTVKGEFVPPPEPAAEVEEALPEQEEFWRPPARFGTVPVEANPLGWDSRRGFHKLYPQVMLPTQVLSSYYYQRYSIRSGIYRLSNRFMDADFHIHHDTLWNWYYC